MTTQASPETGYSVLFFKATRGLSLVAKGLAHDQAHTLADQAYEQSRLFRRADLLPSGVAVFVATDVNAQALLEKGSYHLSDRELIDMCYGSC